MPTDKISQFRKGSLFRLTTGGRTYKVVDISEENGGVILRFQSIRKIKDGYLQGTINLKLITNLHHAREEATSAS